MRKKHFWCYRIDTRNIKFFRSEMQENRLRQGWGWDEKQNLRDLKMDQGAKRNLPMFKKVKKGDIVLIPRLPTWGEVSIVQATEDWNTGYKFEISKEYKDYGHIFPIKYIKKFKRNNENVTGNIRGTLKNPSRFWNINHYASDVEKILSVEESELSKNQDYKSRFENSINIIFNEIFDNQMFENKLFEKVSEQFSREEWEYALVYGLKKLFPFYQIERVGGMGEQEHGTDILVKIPSFLLNYEYCIAIQVKDYSGTVDEKVINQIDKADSYWNSENLKLIEKIVIITKAKEDKNLHLLENSSDVKFIFANDLKQLLSEIGKSFIGMN